MNRVFTNYSKYIRIKVTRSKLPEGMEAHGYLQPAASIISENVPVMVKHDYRDIKIDASTTVTIDLEDIKKRLAEDFYRSQGIGLMLGG